MEVESTPLINQSDSKCFVIFLTCMAALGGLLFGYDTGIVSGSMLLIKDDFQLSSVWQEAIVSATIGAAAIFALISGTLVDKLGRKVVIMLASFVFTVGAVVMAVSPTDTKEVLLVGRLIVGAGIGFASMSVPVYIAEAAPTNIRGSLVTMNQLFITIGILLSSIVAGAFSTDKENGWRYMLGLAAVPSVIQFFGFFFLPESPRWLIAKRREKEARSALERIRGSGDVTLELNHIQQSVREMEEENKYNFFQAFLLIWKTQPVRRALLVGCLLQLFGQLSGINTVIYYSGTILRMSGFPSDLAIWLVCIPFAVNFLFTFIGIYAVERAGRRILTLASFIGIIVALIVLGLGFWFSDKHSPTIAHHLDNSSICHTKYLSCSTCIKDDNCGFCWEKDHPDTSGFCLHVNKDNPERYADPGVNSSTHYNESLCNQTNYHTKHYGWANDFCPTDYSWMAVLGLALFVMSFAPGLGPNPWTINSEIYPLWARGTGISIATAVNWVANLGVSFSFLTLLEAITPYGTFFLYSGISFVGMITLFCLLPETKNKSLEEIEILFMTEEYRVRRNSQRQCTVQRRDVEQME
ncbi:proton myo-inositol cotransporter-like [Saccostrea cucullata]|uniref:proton myo-inositol cotransporter-like n=1 Tax=Saccostrea cuccullata TaxID=36930 RepID=UPI002ED3DE4A